MGEKVKILLAGMHYVPNQFSRGIHSFGCDMVHVKGGEKRDSSVPNCDAVVIAKCQVSHNYFWAAKEAYLERGKPIFVSSHSWSEIAGPFQAWLKSVGHLDEMGRIVKKKTESKPFNTMALKPEETPKEEKVENKSKASSFGAGRARINEIIKALVLQKATWAEVADKLNKEGLHSPRGGTWTNGSINQYAVSRGLAVRRKGIRKGTSGGPFHTGTQGGHVKAIAMTPREQLKDEEIEEIMTSNLNTQLKLKVMRIIALG